MSVLGADAKLSDPAHVAAFIPPPSCKDVSSNLVIDLDLHVSSAGGCRRNALIFDTLGAHSDATTLLCERSHL